jgi:hypothetical protein
MLRIIRLGKSNIYLFGNAQQVGVILRQNISVRSIEMGIHCLFRRSHFLLRFVFRTEEIAFDKNNKPSEQSMKF